MKKLNLKTILLYLSLTASIIFLFYFGCPIYRLFKVQCPACGTARAWICFLKGDIRAALRYNLFFLIMPLFIASYLYWDTLSKKIKFFYPLMALLAAVVFIYNLLRVFGLCNNYLIILG